MNFDRRLTMTATYTPMSADIDRTTGVRRKGTPRDIKCFIFGQVKMYRNDAGEATVSDQTCITQEKVEVGDLINGREVKAVLICNWLNGDEAVREALL